MKSFFRTIHLYLSLAAGIVIAIICLTGAILVFEKEWQMSLFPERYKVEAGTNKASLDLMITNLQSAVKGAKVRSVKVFDDPTRTVEISYMEAEKGGKKKTENAEKNKNKTGTKGKKEEKPKKLGEGGGSTAFMNPYTGELIQLYTHRNAFFYTIFATHRWLLADEIGKLITGISTFIFLFILITGIVLWWPKNRKILQQRLKLKFNGSWKRINHDLHIVIGFYTAIFLFAFAFTGLAWSFEWFSKGIYTITGTEDKRPEPPQSVFIADAKPVSMDKIYATAKAEMPNAEFYNIGKAKDSAGSATVTVMPKNAIHERASNQLFIDQYSGEKIGQQFYSDRNLGQRVRATFYPIHVGSIGGLAGRIIAFISCIAGFTFPITGVILWINRLKKKNKKKTKVGKKKKTKFVQPDLVA
jgi:uncharacterized iron-regulated membrane protein